MLLHQHDNYYSNRFFKVSIAKQSHFQLINKVYLLYVKQDATKEIALYNMMNEAFL